mgnify:CR=1 FL=1
MKKFLVFFTLFILLSCTVFYFGVTNLKVKNDEYGILVSRISGVKDNVIESGNAEYNYLFAKDIKSREKSEEKQLRLDMHGL